ncbi:nucleoside diphosphate kinase homolog 7 isoform X1 [Penaeus vannamei]|uniref:Nucleoside diphosphate kinase 7 n=1 Tax=Penaeus vannamei TaxID=6689 RepID=A0A423U0D3_PENVA|nr:nucleoside diphosphate kinase 7-like isoform X1 [Penaeus vannamei]XP_027207903.1 nucleoside diphosphate kinase 7-like isoform X1 [Penaeus vannamei]ROT82162.1 Nucleoside diphosphate kinase 7 [Penaeus vannamei]
MASKLFTIALVVALAATLINIYVKRQGETRYLFHTEWYDPVSATVRKFLLSFFPRDNAVEMYDLRSQRLFLKRLAIEGLDEKDFYLGNTIVVLSRQLKITEYADSTTREIISSKRQRTFAMVKPDAVHRLGEVIDVIQSRNFEVSQMKMVQLTRAQAGLFYREHEGRPFFEPLLDYVTSGPVVAMELITTNAVQRWRETLGPTDAELARREAPDTIRAKFGKDKQSNAAHGSDSDVAATREIEFFFPSSKVHDIMVPQTTARFLNNTCCIIKPHAIAEGNMGSILKAIKDEGFEVSALQMFRMDKIQAEEFLEVYKGVVSEYPGMLQQLISGPSVAIEITSIHAGQTPVKFREFVGPADPIVAKELRPNSLRARFGENTVKNALHCSDLPDDGPLEVEYFFKILQ